MPLPANASDMIKERAMQLGGNIRETVRSCTDLPTVSAQLQGSVYTRLGQMKPATLGASPSVALFHSCKGGVEFTLQLGVNHGVNRAALRVTN